MKHHFELKNNNNIELCMKTHLCVLKPVETLTFYQIMGRLIWEFIY